MLEMRFPGLPNATGDLRLHEGFDLFKGGQMADGHYLF